MGGPYAKRGGLVDREHATGKEQGANSAASMASRCGCPKCGAARYPLACRTVLASGHRLCAWRALRRRALAGLGGCARINGPQPPGRAGGAHSGGSVVPRGVGLAYGVGGVGECAGLDRSGAHRGSHLRDGAGLRRFLDAGGNLHAASAGFRWALVGASGPTKPPRSKDSRQQLMQKSWPGAGCRGARWRTPRHRFLGSAASPRLWCGRSPTSVGVFAKVAATPRVSELAACAGLGAGCATCAR